MLKTLLKLWRSLQTRHGIDDSMTGDQSFLDYSPKERRLILAPDVPLPGPEDEVL